MRVNAGFRRRVLTVVGVLAAFLAGFHVASVLRHHSTEPYVTIPPVLRLQDSMDEERLLRMDNLTQTMKDKHLGICPPKYGRVAFFVIYTNYAAYAHASNILRCYAQSRNYSLFLVQPFTDPLVQERCGVFGDVFFRKHCAAAVFLSRVDWLVVTDADTAVINADHCVEEFIDPKVEVIFYERFWTSEIAAGNYMVRNTKAARRFLMDWARYEQNFAVFKDQKVPIFTSSDNGALHLAVLKAVFPHAKKLYQKCFALLKGSIWPDYEPGYGKFLACSKRAFKMLTPSKELATVAIKVLCRGQAWVRDTVFSAHMFSSWDFMAHGIKTAGPFNSSMLARLSSFANNTIPAECKNPEWKPYFNSKNPPKQASLTEMRKEMAQFAKNCENSRLKPVFGTREMGRCWPMCPPVLDLPV